MAEYISDAEVLQRALDTYGSALQIVVMMEEMSELQKELCKYLRGKILAGKHRRGDRRCGDHARANEDAVLLRRRCA